MDCLRSVAADLDLSLRHLNDAVGEPWKHLIVLGKHLGRWEGTGVVSNQFDDFLDLLLVDNTFEDFLDGLYVGVV